VTDGTHQAVQTVSEVEDSVPFLYVSCIDDGRILWQEAARIARSTYAEISKGRVPVSGMVLYTAVGSYGHAAALTRAREFAFQRHIACVYPDNRHLDSEFLSYWLNSEWVKAHADRVALGNAQKTVTLGRLATYPVVMPPKAEQTAILTYLSALERRVHAEEADLAKRRRLASGLSRDLLTGRVRVSASEEVAL
jgi:type I restriction enzyme S subunit